MKTLDESKLNHAKTQKFDFKIGDYFNQAITIFSNNWQDFTLFALASAGIYLLSIFTIIGPYFIMFPLMIGYGIVTEKIEKGENFVFNDFFKGFDKWQDFLVLILIIFAFSLLFIIPYFFFLFGIGLFSDNPEEISPFVGLSIVFIFPFFMLIGIVFSVLIFLPPYLIYYGNMGAIESIKQSIQIAKKNFWYLLLFVLLQSVISQLGAFACYIGLLATIPFGYIMGYLLIKDMLLSDDAKTEIDLLGTNQE